MFSQNCPRRGTDCRTLASTNGRLSAVAYVSGCEKAGRRINICRLFTSAIPLTPFRCPTAHQLGAPHIMFSRSTACRGAQRAVGQQVRRNAQRRGLAAPASGTFQYQSGDAQGVKFASRDFTGPTTTLALVAKAGTRYQPLPGLTEGLANFAFRVRCPSD